MVSSKQLIGYYTSTARRRSRSFTVLLLSSHSILYSYVSSFVSQTSIMQQRKRDTSWDERGQEMHFLPSRVARDSALRWETITVPKSRFGFASLGRCTKYGIESVYGKLIIALEKVFVSALAWALKFWQFTVARLPHDINFLGMWFVCGWTS